MNPSLDSPSIHIAVLHRKGAQFMAQRLGPWGLGTGLHPYVLALEAGPCLQVELSRRLMVDKANTARAVAKLESMGLLERTTPPGDQRAWKVALTPEGHDLVPRIRAALDEWDMMLRSALDKDAAAGFGTMLRTLASLDLPSS